MSSLQEHLLRLYNNICIVVVNFGITPHGEEELETEKDFSRWGQH